MAFICEVAYIIFALLVCLVDGLLYWRQYNLALICNKTIRAMLSLVLYHIAPHIPLCSYVL